MNIIILGWKAFSVNLEKVHTHLKQNLSSNYDGLICDDANLKVAFKEAYSQADSDIVVNYWDSVTETTFLPTQQEVITSAINDAIMFGNSLIVQAIVENIALGITQANKTKVVSDYCFNLQNYLRTGSLYAAIQEIDTMVADPGRAALEMEPFITTERLTSYKQKIQDYLT